MSSKVKVLSKFRTQSSAGSDNKNSSIEGNSCNITVKTHAISYDFLGISLKLAIPILLRIQWQRPSLKNITMRFPFIVFN